MTPLPKFRLHTPTTLREALTMLANLDGARPIAGGTDLLPSLRDGAIKAEHLVDLTDIDEIRGIEMVSEEVHIGAMTTLTEIVKSEVISEKAPVIGDAAAQIGSVQTRNQGTLVGNICNASPAADSAPALIVLGASLEVASTDGSRTMPITDLFMGPKINSLRPGELVTEVRFPVPPSGSGAAFEKLGRRRGYTLSIVNAAAYLEIEGDFCRKARLALGAVAATPLRMHVVEGLLRGERLTEEVIKEASSACYGLVNPIDDVRGSAEYRQEMSCVLMKRVVRGALVRARM